MDAFQCTYIALNYIRMLYILANSTTELYRTYACI